MTIDILLRDRLIEQGRKLTEDRGWPWLDPVEVTTGIDRSERVWIIRTNVLMLGRNVRIVLRQSDCTVKQAGYMPR
jgi:hypothetical protein